MLTQQSENIDRIVGNVLDADFKNFSQEILENAKNRIIDVIGCLISGTNAPGNLSLVEMVKSWGGRKDATILIHGIKAPVHNVAMVNSIMARSYDFEPVMAFVDGINIPSHISATTVMSALALSEYEKKDGKDLITALLVGEDVACRLLATTGFGFARGWDCIGTVNTFGVTAIAGRLIGLKKDQLRNAFGIALNQLGGSLQNIWDGTLCFKLPQGLSARNGIFSAELAKVGWDGPKDALLSNFGYFNLFTEGRPNLDILTEGLGKKFYTEATFKPYPCCRANHAAVECALKIANNNKIEVGDINQIIIKVDHRVFDMFVAQPFSIRTNSQIDAAFNIYYCVANVLLRKGLFLEHFEEDQIKSPEIKSLIGKIKIEKNEAPTANKYKTSLTVEVKNNFPIFAEVELPKGDPSYSRLSKNEIIEKFMYNISFSRLLPKGKALELLKLIDGLEEVKNIRELINMIKAN